MLDRMYLLKHLQMLISLYFNVINYQKKNVKDRFQIFMNMNSIVKLLNLIQNKLLKIMNQYLLKNILYLVGSNGIQSKN